MRRGVPDSPGWRCLEAIADGERRLTKEREPRVLPDERARILGGDTSAIVRHVDAPFEPGQTEVLSWSRRVRSFDAETQRVVEIPRRSLFEIAVVAKTKRRAGGCSVRFNVFDRRPKTRLVRVAPPVYDADLMKRDQPDDPMGLVQAKELDASETAKAREESAYTTSPTNAVDELEAVDDLELVRQRHLADSSWLSLKAREERRARVKTLASRMRTVESHAALLDADASPFLDAIESKIHEFEAELAEMKAVA